MSNDLISRQAAIDRINKQREHLRPDVYPQDKIGDAAYRICAEFIERLPSAQPERKKGTWQITDAYPHNVYCSECHKRFAQTHWSVWEDGSLPRNFCPYCGARMDGERREDA